MAGLNVEDLLNLTNAGELQANDKVALFVTAKPNVDNPSKYRWQIFRQEADKQPVVLVMTDSHPGVALADQNHCYYSTLNEHQNSTNLWFVDLNTGANTRTTTFAGHQFTLVKKLVNDQLLLTGKFHFCHSDHKPWHEVNEVPF